MIAERGTAPVDIGHQAGEAAEQQIARRAEAARDVAEPCRGRQPDRLGHHVVAVDQRVAQEVAQRHALMDGENIRPRRREAAQRRGERDALGARELPEDIAGVQPGVLDRQLRHLAAAAAVGDPPDHGALVVALELDPAGRQQPRRGAFERGLVEWRQRRGIDPTAAPPGDADAVERQRQGADARIVGGLRRLPRRDFGEARQDRVVDEKAAIDIVNAVALQAHRELQQIGHVQSRVAAASENQVAMEHAGIDRAAREQLGAVAVLRAEHVERDHGRRQLGGGRRNQRQIGVELGELLAALEIDQQIADGSARRAGGHQRRGRATVRGDDRGPRRRKRLLDLEVGEHLVDLRCQGSRGGRRDQSVRFGRRLDCGAVLRRRNDDLALRGTQLIALRRDRRDRRG